jgi:ribosomal 50S subunit-associated protein YjgA (DUF615 family)
MTEDEEDRRDAAFIQRAKRNAQFRPLRDVLADLEAAPKRRRVRFFRPVRQTRRKTA